ncbi:MAG: SOS response-associated peptidase [Rhodovarius sp.]|nr:SOS response-associated peptidase [Rhodovarius sp.]
MCGRYFLQREPAELARHFAVAGPLPNYAPSWNIAPTQAAPVLRRHPQTGARHLDLLSWGLVPHWAKDASGAARLINARAESLAAKPSFRDAFARRRCLVPMDGFYEWQRRPGGGKQPFAVALCSGEPMAVAGLWEGWRQPDGAWLRSFAIVTTASEGRQARIHERMPAILPRQDWAVWLGEAPGDPASVLRPYPSERLAIWPIHPRVGRVEENDPALLQRADAQVPPELDDAPVY